MPTRIPFPPARQRGISAEQSAKLVQLYTSGIPGPEAMRRVGGNVDAVYYHLRQAGVQVRNGSDAKRIYNVRHDYFSDISTPEQAWVLGFISADGCVREIRGYGILQIGVATRDRDCLETIRGLLEYDGPIIEGSYWSKRSATKRRQLQHQSVLAIRSNQIFQDLRSLGVHPRKSLTLKPWRGPAHLMPHYFRGLVDGDGTISKTLKKNGRVHWTVGLAGTHPTIRAFVTFINGMVGSKATPYKHPPIWSCNFGGMRRPQEVATILYKNATVSLRRKQLLAEELMAAQCIYPRHPRWTVRQLLHLRREHGSWRAVGRFSGSRSAIQHARRRLGML